MTLYRVTAQSLEVLSVSAAASRVSAQSLEVLTPTYQIRLPKAYALTVLGPNPAAVAVSKAYALVVLDDGSVPAYGTLWRVNCGSSVALTGWNNDANPDPTTLSNLVTSTGGASTRGWYCDVWDISKTDGIGHADLPTEVGASYLKWYGAGRTLRFTGLDNAQTYAVTLYSTAPGAVSNNWTVAGTTKALSRGGKAQWTGLTPSSGTLEFVSASSTSGTDVTLSAALLLEGTPPITTTRRRPVVALIG
jgi:hypothetical protein